MAVALGRPPLIELGIGTGCDLGSPETLTFRLGVKAIWVSVSGNSTPPRFKKCTSIRNIVKRLKENLHYYLHSKLSDFFKDWRGRGKKEVVVSEWNLLVFSFIPKLHQNIHFPDSVESRMYDSRPFTTPSRCYYLECTHTGM